MRRAILMSAFVVPVILLIAGVAYARTIDCNGGDCKGHEQGRHHERQPPGR